MELMNIGHAKEKNTTIKDELYVDEDPSSN